MRTILRAIRSTKIKFVGTEIVPGELLPEKCDPLNPLCNKMKWPKNNSRKT